MKTNIKDFNLNLLKEELKKLGEKPFRAEQIFKWIYIEKVNSFDKMTNLSLELRKKLEENYTLGIFKIVKKLESKDGTQKYLFGHCNICLSYDISKGEYNGIDFSRWCKVLRNTF